MAIAEIPCNTVEGLKGYLTDLEGLNRLMSDRRKAAYGKDGEFRGGLKEFMIMGRWSTDSCGNFGDMTMLDSKYRPLPPEKLEEVVAQLPSVIGRDDFFRYVKGHGVESISVSGTRCSVAPVHVQCRECGQRWSLENAHDAVITTGSPEFDSSAYVGRTFKDLDADLRARTDAHCFIDGELAVKHDRFIDMTPHPTIADFYENKDGWIHLGHWNDERRARDPAGFVKMIGRLGQPELGEAGGYDPWKYVFQPGDRMYGHAVYYTHRRCLDLKRSRDSRDYYVGIFKDAGFPDAVTREVPNERCQDVCCLPWQVAQFPFGDVKVGWRSSVISIDWSKVDGSPDLSSLFEDVESTKWATGVHANTREQAVEYLRRLKSFLDAGLRCDSEGCPSPPSRFFRLEGKVEGRCARHNLRGAADEVPFLEALVSKVHST